jgi:site-specific DNA-methyltransferase (adenine-specific)
MSFKLHNKNCFDWLKDQAPNSFHGVLTDPPFGVLEFTPEEVAKLRSGRGGVWRIPPKMGGSERAPLPRFTTLTVDQREHVRTYFQSLGEALKPALVPGAHVMVAGTPMLQYLVQDGMATAGFEVRGAVIRLYRGFRGGDRPKLAEDEFPEVCVTPRGNYEPWMIFRKPISERTVSENLRRWGTGALRRININTPFPDVIQSGRTPLAEELIGKHPTQKPQHIMRILARSLLPLGKGVILEPFAGSGSTIAACEAIGYESVGVELDEIHFGNLGQNIELLSSMYPNFKGQSIDPIGNLAALNLKKSAGGVNQPSLI